MEVDNDDVPRRRQRAGKPPLQFILQEEAYRVRSWLRFVSESTNFTMRCLYGRLQRTHDHRR